MHISDFVSEFLGFMERQETKLLSWGFYGGCFVAQELEELFLNEASEEMINAWSELQLQGWSISSFMGELEHAGLLYRIEAGRDIYRTRFAEGVRLFANLRQLFKAADWAIAPRLVSDMKVHLNARSYPRRDQGIDDCWKDLESHCEKKSLQRALFEALCTDRAGTPIKFAGFQRRAFSRILSHYQRSGIGGSVISAGTGSGKTKAFFIPALLGMATELNRGVPAFTKIIAIYPRNVLLADQLREAISEASRVKEILARHGCRPLTFGALMGQTPEEWWFDSNRDRRTIAEGRGWRRIADGFVIPFVKGLSSSNCELVWRDSDRRSGRTCLFPIGSDSTQPELVDGILRITREQLQTSPPDVLFLSAEMLNREMGNSFWARAFGFGQGDHAPRILVLDEIHAYEGLSGAQIAWILKRWRFWSKLRNLHVVGLSATLKEACSHLGILCGISPTSIVEFNPHSDEMTLEGMEYNLAIKGDPASGTSLLATSIQCGMLLARLLTPRHASTPPSNDRIHGSRLYSRKVFGFTDNLDVLNRWYSDISDAERHLRLAKLRMHPSYQYPPPTPVPSPLLIRRMEETGQIWELPRRLGHNLNQPLEITRCSSQDPGANADSDLIVASSSLEVGYDDPEVGAILHHKTPISISSFIQRKGRAGRHRGTRPWTIIVLSDYGMDRWSFQNAERLFQPEIENLALPVLNPYVLRIQATYFLIDWLGRQLHKGSSFLNLSGSIGDPEFQQGALRILKGMLDLKEEWQAFRRDFSSLFSYPYGRGARKLTDSELDAILWHEPRPLMLQVVPTLCRKLEAHWSLAKPGITNESEDANIGRPLPEFLPRATFFDIDQSECRLFFPEAHDKNEESLNAARALFEACPGRVSKRFSLAIGERGYWLEYSSQLPNLPETSRVSVHQLFPESVALGEVNGTVIYEPKRIHLRHRPTDVLDSSNASWNWESRFVALGTGQILPLFSTQPWNAVITKCESFVHRNNAGIDVLRFSRSCNYEIRRRRQEPRRGVLQLQSQSGEFGDVQQAVGFGVRADGIRFSLDQSIIRKNVDLDEQQLCRLRADYFLHRIRSDEVLQKKANAFLAEWLWQTSISMLASTALHNRCSIEVAQVRLKNLRAAASQKVLDSIFQVQTVDSEISEVEGRLKATISELWQDQDVVSRIEILETCLWNQRDAEFDRWLRRRFVSTIAQAIYRVIAARSPDVSEDELMLDVLYGADESADIFLTETTSGGLGHIEGIANEINASPEAFQDGFCHAIVNCPRQRIADTIKSSLLSSLISSSQLKDAFARVRVASDFASLIEARDCLKDALASEGIDSSRSSVVSIASKLLQPGSSVALDRVLHFLNLAWDRTGQKLGLFIDSRVFAYACVQYAPLRKRLFRLFTQISGGLNPSNAQLFSIIQQLLIPDCIDSCPECLDQPNRYNDFGRPSRSLVHAWITFSNPSLDVQGHTDQWVNEIKEILARDKIATLVVSRSELPSVAVALQRLLGTELEVGILLMPIFVSRIERRAATMQITLQLKDAI